MLDLAIGSQCIGNKRAIMGPVRVLRHLGDVFLAFALARRHLPPELAARVPQGVGASTPG